MLDTKEALPRGHDLVASLLGFMSAEEERLERFFLVTGLDVDGLKEAAAGPAFAECLADYLLEEDGRVVSVAEHLGVAPERAAMALLSLRQPPKAVRTTPPSTLRVLGVPARRLATEGC